MGVSAGLREGAAANNEKKKKSASKKKKKTKKNRNGCNGPLDANMLPYVRKS